jgi:formiminotetrahydrofolate cyclodeaminase
MCNLDLSLANEFEFAPVVWMDVNLEVRQLTAEFKKIYARLHPLLEKDFRVYRAIFRKLPKRDSHRIKRLK